MCGQPLLLFLGQCQRGVWLALGSEEAQRGKTLRRGARLLRCLWSDLCFFLPVILRSISGKLDPQEFFGYFKFIAGFLCSPDAVRQAKACKTFILLLLYSFCHVLDPHEGNLLQIEACLHCV